MDHTKISDRCIVKVIRNGEEIEKSIGDEEQSEKQLVQVLETILQRLTLKKEREKENDC